MFCGGDDAACTPHTHTLGNLPSFARASRDWKDLCCTALSPPQNSNKELCSHRNRCLISFHYEFERNSLALCSLKRILRSDEMFPNHQVPHFICSKKPDYDSIQSVLWLGVACKRLLVLPLNLISGTSSDMIAYLACLIDTNMELQCQKLETWTLAISLRCVITLSFAAYLKNKKFFNLLLWDTIDQNICLESLKWFLGKLWFL